METKLGDLRASKDCIGVDFGLFQSLQGPVSSIQ